MVPDHYDWLGSPAGNCLPDTGVRYLQSNVVYFTISYPVPGISFVLDTYTYPSPSGRSFFVRLRVQSSSERRGFGDVSDVV